MTRFVELAALLSALVLFTGLSACDSSGGLETDPPTEDTAPPGAPSSLTGISEDGAVSLEWNAPSDDDLDGYRVCRSGSNFSSIGNAEEISAGLASATDYRDESAENGTRYYYGVTAVNEAGNESDLSESIAKTPLPNPPDSP